MADDPNTPPADGPNNTPPADPADPPKDPPANNGDGEPPAPSTALADGADGGGDGDGDSDGNEPKTPADFPDDWREKMAGDDKKFLNVLKRYASPITFANAFKAHQQKIRSGELKTPLPENASDEQVAQWRKENGIPEKPEDYDLGKIEISDEDRPQVDEYLKVAHDQNFTPDQVKANLATYFKLKADAEEQLAERDAATKAETEDALRAEFGGDYRRNMQAITTLLEGGPEGLYDNLMGARLADGTKLGDNANALRWLVQTARELNPMPSVTIGGSENQLQSIEDRLAEISKFRRENRTAYNKDEKMQQEERDLIDAQARLKRRDAA